MVAWFFDCVSGPKPSMGFNLSFFVLAKIQRPQASVGDSFFLLGSLGQKKHHGVPFRCMRLKRASGSPTAQAVLRIAIVVCILSFHHGVRKPTPRFPFPPSPPKVSFGFPRLSGFSWISQCRQDVL